MTTVYSIEEPDKNLFLKKSISKTESYSRIPATIQNDTLLEPH